MPHFLLRAGGLGPCRGSSGAARRDLGSVWAASTRGLGRAVLVWARLIVPCLLGLLLVVRLAHALEVPPLEGRINDRAGVLPIDVRRELEARLTAYESNTGHQLAVLVVRSLEGDPIEDFSMRVVEAWKLGRKDRDDGMLLLIAVDDRKLRIEVGYGLEGELPDALAGRIIREVIVPAFRQGQLAQGITRAVEAMMAATGGEGEPLPPQRVQPRRRSEGGLPPYLLLLLVLLLFMGGGRRGGGAFVAGALMGMGGRGGRSGGGFGGGGFRGGGGGFGGGGASGSW
jgi:uncharacterized protein